LQPVSPEEGYEQISGIFIETAENERTRQSIFKHHRVATPDTASYPAGFSADTGCRLPLR
jgi:hypothetical protein